MNNRHSPFKRTVAAIAALSWSAVSIGASPGDLMFSHTQGQASNTATSSNYFGGNYSVRAPKKTYQIFAGDPPRFTAGCGGIDLHLGSFSFISVDAFKDMLRKIAQSAPGYFLHLAIQVMCNPCAVILAQLQTLMSELNNMQANSCQLGKKVGAAMFTSIFEGNIGDDSVFKKGYDNAMTEVDKVRAGDWPSALGLSSISKALEGLTLDEKKLVNAKNGRGNLLIHQFVSQGIGGKFEWQIFGGAVNAAELMSSMFGTTISPLVDNEDSASKQIPDGDAVARQDKALVGTLTVDDLVNGPDDSQATYHKCAKAFSGDNYDGCEDVDVKKWLSVSPKGSSDFRGTREWAHRMLFGNTDLTSPQISGSGMLASIRNGVPLNAQQLQLLQVAPVGSFGLMLEVKHYEPALINMGLTIRKIVEENAALELARLLLTAFDTLKSNNNSRIVGSDPAKNPLLTNGTPNHALERQKVISAELLARDNAARTNDAVMVETQSKRAALLRSYTPTFAASTRSGR